MLLYRIHSPSIHLLHMNEEIELAHWVVSLGLESRDLLKTNAQEAPTEVSENSGMLRYTIAKVWYGVLLGGEAPVLSRKQADIISYMTRVENVWGPLFSIIAPVLDDDRRVEEMTVLVALLLDDHERSKLTTHVFWLAVEHDRERLGTAMLANWNPCSEPDKVFCPRLHPPSWIRRAFENAGIEAERVLHILPATTTSTYNHVFGGIESWSRVRSWDTNQSWFTAMKAIVDDADFDVSLVATDHIYRGALLVSLSYVAGREPWFMDRKEQITAEWIQVLYHCPELDFIPKNTPLGPIPILIDTPSLFWDLVFPSIVSTHIRPEWWHRVVLAMVPREFVIRRILPHLTIQCRIFVERVILPLLPGVSGSGGVDHGMSETAAPREPPTPIASSPLPLPPSP